MPPAGTILTASCDPGEVATGGGQSSSNAHITVGDTAPMTNGSISTQGQTPTGSWVNAKTDDTGTYSARALVVRAS